MTDEAKLQILNYIVNNINKTPPNNDEIFLEQEEIDGNKFLGDIRREFPEDPEGYWNVWFEGMIESNELTSNLSIIYGGVQYANSKNIGIIVLVDESFNVVKTIYNFDSGTPLRYIQNMKQAEDGTFYFIDDEAFKTTLTSSSEKRFVMVNNFTLKNKITEDYEVDLRKSYIFGTQYKNFYCKEMYKDNNSSHYIFFGASQNENQKFNDIKIIELGVNVGMPNVWNIVYQDINTIYGGSIVLFQDDEEISQFKFRCICSSLYEGDTTIDCISKDFTGTATRTPIITFNYEPKIETLNYENQCVFINYDEVYFVQNNQGSGRTGYTMAKYIGLYKYNFTNGSYITIYEKSLGNYDFCNIENMYISKCNTDIYVMFCDNINNGYADYYFQRLVNDVWSPKIIQENKWFMRSAIGLLVKSNFNLLQAYIFGLEISQFINFQYLIKEDYNVSNYNGTTYIDYDSLISQKGQIYSNNKLVFARNIYNKYINNATTTSTIQIPNNYLNGIELSLKNLISKTNLDICEDLNTISKNIYEMVFLNYINTLTVLDEDTGTLYNETATFINTNINTGTETNYNNTYIGKVRINYSTPQIQLINWTWNVDHYETSFTIYTSEIPSSIEFISNDETTTYITKTLELEANKFYTISQKLRIE